ncbi:MAG: LamG-like jellyroll fold domain-containing protein [Sedimentisphaerales bacterium]
MNKKILLMALVLCLIAGSNLLAANLLLNPGFEDTNGIMGQFNKSGTVIVNWVQWGSTNGWYHNDIGKVRGLRAVKLWMSDTATYQDFVPSVGSVYDVNVYAYSSSTDPPVNGGLKGLNGILMVQWLDSTKTVEKGTQIIGYFYGRADPNHGSDPLDTWKLISGMCTPSAGTAYGRVWLKLVDTNTAATLGSLNWDDVSVIQNLYTASNPNPTNGSTVDSSAPVTLSWTRPAPRHQGPITCDVWFGTDPCMPGTNTKIVSKQAADSNLVGMLASSTDYYWRVDCYDPNDGSGNEVKTNGMPWAFTTKNQPPTVDAGDKQAVWLASGSATVAMDAVVTDDGFPLIPGYLTYSWTKVSGPGTPTFSPSNTVKDPNVTFTTAGDYILCLTVSDGQYDANDTVKIRVYAQGYTGLVAYWKLDANATDSSGNHHDGTVYKNGVPYGTPVWTTGQVNGAIELDGDNEYVSPDDEGWADFTEEMTVSAWIKCTFTKPWEAIVTKGDSSWRLFRDSANGDSNNASFTLNDIGPVVSGSTGDVGDNRWHQVVGTLDGVHQCIYVDGILAASVRVPEGSTIALNNNYVDIGEDDEHESEGRSFKGLIDEVRIYEIGLPANMVLQQFIADGGHDSCGRTYLPGDMNKDCYINFADFAIFAESWLHCNDVTNLHCQ